MRFLIIILSVFFALNLSSCATRVVERPTKVVYVKKAPRHYKMVKVKGNRYYFWNGKHYKKTRRGYVVVKV
jgi:hypothetical protein